MLGHRRTRRDHVVRAVGQAGEDVIEIFAPETNEYAAKAELTRDLPHQLNIESRRRLARNAKRRQTVGRDMRPQLGAALE